MTAAFEGPVRPLDRRTRAYRAFRRATSPLRILPSFAVIGAQRAGTTSLFDDLLHHPEIAGPSGEDKRLMWPEKELDFFSNRYYEGLGWYRGFFPTTVSRRRARRAGRSLIAGEATPFYLVHPGAPERMAATLPGMRLVVLLRDPVARAYSHYQLNRRTGLEPLSFEDALASEEDRLAGEGDRLRADPRYRSPAFRLYSYFTRGLYAEQLERWLAHFPREQFAIYSAEEFFARRDEVYREIVAFLGVRPKRRSELPWRRTLGGRTSAAAKAKNRVPYDPLDPALRAALEERYAEPNARLVGLLERRFPWAAPPATATPAAPASRTRVDRS